MAEQSHKLLAFVVGVSVMGDGGATEGEEQQHTPYSVLVFHLHLISHTQPLSGVLSRVFILLVHRFFYFPLPFSPFIRFYISILRSFLLYALGNLSVQTQ